LELVAREGKYQPVGIKFPSQATLAQFPCSDFGEKSSFCTKYAIPIAPKYRHRAEFRAALAAR